MANNDTRNTSHGATSKPASKQSADPAMKQDKTGRDKSIEDKGAHNGRHEPHAQSDQQGRKNG